MIKKIKCLAVQFYEYKYNLKNEFNAAHLFCRLRNKNVNITTGIAGNKLLAVFKLINITSIRDDIFGRLNFKSRYVVISKNESINIIVMQYSRACRMSFL